MQRVKDWLIKKLGGYTAQEMMDSKWAYRTMRARWHAERFDRAALEKEYMMLKRKLGEDNNG